MKIGEITKLFGISPDTLRFYEEKGLIHPDRDEKTKYRDYSIWSILGLSDCLKYKGLGFALNDIKYIFEGQSHDSYNGLVNNRISVLEEEIFQKQMILNDLKSYCEHLEFARINVGNHWYQNEPERKLYILANMEEGRFRDFEYDDSVMRHWVEHITHLKTYVIMSARGLSDGRSYIWCYGTESSTAGMFNLPEGKLSITLPSGVYYHAIINTPNNTEAFDETIRIVLSELKIKKSYIDRNIICRLLERYFENENWYSLIEVMIPVEEND